VRPRNSHELRDIERARGSSKALETAHPVQDEQSQVLGEADHFTGLLDILKDAAAAIVTAQERAGMIKQQAAALVAMSKAEVQAAEAASKALERNAHDATETIRSLELRAIAAEERVRALEARLERARQALDHDPSVSKNLIPLRPNLAVKGPQPLFQSC
jgi:hypothetical protein